MSAEPWSVERSSGPAQEFHQRPLLVDPGSVAVWVHRVERPAIVLGSAQRDDVLNRAAAERAGFEVAGRRSGGGLVVVEPDESCWIDVLVEREHPRWVDDVHRAFDWVGDWWFRALASLGVPGLAVHRGPLVRREAGRVVCFAGLGPGEVVQRHDDGAVHKIVGLSQRRTRAVARFQGLYLRRWNPEPLTRFVDDRLLDGVGLSAAELERLAAGTLDGPAPSSVADAFVAAADLGHPASDGIGPGTMDT